MERLLKEAKIMPLEALSDLSQVNVDNKSLQQQLQVRWHVRFKSRSCNIVLIYACLCMFQMVLAMPGLSCLAQEDIRIQKRLKDALQHVRD